MSCVYPTIGYLLHALSKLEQVLSGIAIKPHIRVILNYDLDELKTENNTDSEIKKKLRIINRMQRTYKLFNQPL